jgi:GntR family transcriptional regulator
MPEASLLPASILRDSKMPLYHQLYEILRGRVVGGEWKAGDLIPSESDLIRTYEVSRITVRQALDALAQEGLVYRQRGRGTFVAHQTVEQGLSRIITFTEEMRQRGFTPGTKVIAAGLTAATAEIAERLAIKAGDELVSLKRLRLADGEPMRVEESFLIHRLCPGFLDRDYRNRPLRELLEAHYGIRWLRARQTIRAISAPKKLAALLTIPANAAVLYVERVSFSQDNAPVEYLQLYHRGDRYALYGELHR